MLQSCPHCEGLTPRSTPHCVHCEAPCPPVGDGLVRAARSLAQAATGGAVAVTLMACYGLPAEEGPTEAACLDAPTIEALDDTVVIEASTAEEATFDAFAPGCFPDTNGNAERSFIYQLPAGIDAASVRVRWQSDVPHRVALLGACSYRPGAAFCAEPAREGEATGTFTEREEITVVVEAEGEETGPFRLEIDYATP